MSRRFMFGCFVRVMAVGLGPLAGSVGEARAGNEVQKLTASDAAAGDQFGHSVSVSGDTAVVGASGDDCAAGGSCGSAYVFRFDGATWVEEQKLTAWDLGRYDYFGHSVSVSGDTAVVGASGDDCAGGDDCGSAYVFRFDGATWVEEQKLTASDAAVGDEFGHSVSVSGDTAVVGAPPPHGVCFGFCGSAYVFRFDGARWVQEQKLTAWDAMSGDAFAYSVSLSGDTAVVGARLDNCPFSGTNCGSGYVYRFDGATWVLRQRLFASNARGGEHFGQSVSVNGDTAVFGAPGDDGHCWGPDCGSVYIFRFNGVMWVHEQKVTASDAVRYEEFGDSVSVSGDTAVFGASGDDCAAGEYCGSAYVFRFDGATWAEEQKLTASDAAPGDRFGRSVSVSGDTAVVGASGDDCAAGVYCGSAYVFSVAREPVSLREYAAFQNCFTGTGGVISPGCEPFDFEPDGDVDLDDFKEFLLALTGP